MKTQTYEWLIDGRPDGKVRKKGDTVELTDAQAKYHLQAGVLRLAEEPVKTASKAQPKSASKTAPKTSGNAD